MAGTIIADYIRADANKLSLNVANTVVATLNANGFYTSTGTAQLFNAAGQVGTNIIGTTQIQDLAITAAKMGYAGAIVQTVWSTSGSTATTNSTSYVDDGNEVSITPMYSNSKILVICHSGSSIAGAHGYHRILESTGTTQVAEGPWGNFDGIGRQQLNNFVLMGIYNNASTTQKTFKLQGYISTSSGLRYRNYATTPLIMAMEIKQ